LLFNFFWKAFTFLALKAFPFLLALNFLANFLANFLSLCAIFFASFLICLWESPFPLKSFLTAFLAACLTAFFFAALTLLPLLALAGLDPFLVEAIFDNFFWIFLAILWLLLALVAALANFFVRLCWEH